MTFYSGAPRGYDAEGGQEFTERVVHIRRVAKVVKGGRHLSFNAMVVVGDGRGRVGVGLGKGVAVPDAVRKGNTIARRQMVLIPLKGSTIPHMVRAHFGASHVLIKPAPAGAGIVAGGALRAVMEAAGIRDVVAKALGSRNPINVVKATLEGLQLLQGEITAEQLMAPPLAAPASQGRRDGQGTRPRRDVRPSPVAAVIREEAVPTAIVGAEAPASAAERGEDTEAAGGLVSEVAADAEGEALSATESDEAGESEGAEESEDDEATD